MLYGSRSSILKFDCKILTNSELKGLIFFIVVNVREKFLNIDFLLLPI